MLCFHCVSSKVHAETQSSLVVGLRVASLGKWLSHDGFIHMERLLPYIKAIENYSRFFLAHLVSAI